MKAYKGQFKAIEKQQWMPKENSNLIRMAELSKKDLIGMRPNFMNILQGSVKRYKIEDKKEKLKVRKQNESDEDFNLNSEH